MSKASVMRMIHACSLVSWLLLIVVGTGCGSHLPFGEIPFGTWSGQGVFVYESWKQAEENAVDPEPRSLSRRYPTSLTIRPRELDGHDVIELEILSHHGGVPDMDEHTHLKVALAKAKRGFGHRLAGGQSQPRCLALEERQAQDGSG